MLTRIFIVTIMMIMVCCNAVSPVKASEEDILQPYEVTVVADARKPFGEVAVEIKTNKDPKKLKMTSIRLKINEEWKSVPEEFFVDLEKPDLNSLQIRTEAGHEKVHGSIFILNFFTTTNLADMLLIKEYISPIIKIDLSLKL